MKLDSHAIKISLVAAVLMAGGVVRIYRLHKTFR